jgi:hypothetical protein
MREGEHKLLTCPSLHTLLYALDVSSAAEAAAPHLLALMASLHSRTAALSTSCCRNSTPACNRFYSL